MENRSAKIHRKTNETDIAAEIVLDGQAKRSISMGVGFFDHILEAQFKAFAQALREAIERTGSEEVPSTKGVL